MAESGTSKSQLYHYFANKDALLQAVTERQTEQVMRAQAPHLDRLDSLDGLRRWRDAIVVLQAEPTGCPLGALASEMADESEGVRRLLVCGFERWESHVRDGLAAMQARGALSPEADPAALATGTICALQGGLLLARTTRSPRPVAVALDMAIGHIARFAKSTGFEDTACSRVTS